MTATSLIYYNDQWGKVIPRCMRLEYGITGAKAASALVPNSGSLVFFDAVASQAVVDGFLGTTNEFIYTVFGTTSMGADAFGGLVNMGGQCRSVTEMVAKCYSNTGGADFVQRQVVPVTITDAATTQVQVGADGNIGFVVQFGNTPDFDGLTSGTIVIEIYWVSK